MVSLYRSREKIALTVVVYPTSAYVLQPGISHPNLPPNNTNGYLMQELSLR
ncbi:16285_t:CDS:2 [Funneliformis caledonium]|uniref:16285_t:CDS:1 n=1 Tax=Funneliformis caledonium TaxID=1117310 RepID=A0A9N9E4P7_9GLOM|nr:16285_t:CDS:2 [Funneliformis caledonium]